MAPTTVRLVAFDLDGTVFPNPLVEAVSDRLAADLAAAHDQGVVTCIASGRPTWMMGDQLPHAPWMDWALSLNGSYIAPLPGSGHEGREGLASPIPHELALALLDEVVGLGGCASLHLREHSLIDEERLAMFMADDKPLPIIPESPEQEAELRAALRSHNPMDALIGSGLAKCVPSLRGALEADPTLELMKADMSLPSAAEVDEVVAWAAEVGGLEVARLGGGEIEVSRARVSKGHAIGKLCRFLGIDESCAVAFGDSGNDLSMTGRATHFVAMANATPEIKAAADEVCASVFDDGVAQWLEEHVL